jgi:hypothetical protein
VTIDPDYRPPKRVTVTVIARSSLKEVSDILSASIVERLNSEGVEATLVSENNQTPDALVSVGKWDPGSQSLRWLVGFGSGKGQITVVVDQGLGVKGTAEGWVTGGWFGGSSDNAVVAAGHLIADTIATGKAPEKRP